MSSAKENNSLQYMCTKNAIPEFIMKIYSILEKNEFESIISWSQNGTEIHIKNSKALEEQVLPVFFRHKKIESFIRQLNMYRFNKVNKVNKLRDHMYFKNELFRKGSIESLSMIKRKKKGHADDHNDQSSTENDSEGLESYKSFVKENISLLQQELNKIRKSHPELSSEILKVFQYSNTIIGQQTNPNLFTTYQVIPTQQNLFHTIKELFPMSSLHNFDSKCSIEGEIKQPGH